MTKKGRTKERGLQGQRQKNNLIVRKTNSSKGRKSQRQTKEN